MRKEDDGVTNIDSEEVPEGDNFGYLGSIVHGEGEIGVDVRSNSS